LAGCEPHENRHLRQKMVKKTTKTAQKSSQSAMQKHRAKRARLRKEGFCNAVDHANKRARNGVTSCPNSKEIEKLIRSSLRNGHDLHRVTSLAQRSWPWLVNARCYVIPYGARVAKKPIRGRIRGFVPRRKLKKSARNTFWAVFFDDDQRTMAALPGHVFVNTKTFYGRPDVQELKLHKKFVPTPGYGSQGNCQPPFYSHY
jgi:hypothetical protein